MGPDEDVITLYCPDGCGIKGTLEDLTACAETSGFTKKEDGTWQPEHNGDTDVYWDSQTTRKSVTKGDIYVVCYEGDIHLLSECQPQEPDKDEESDPTAAPPIEP